jgi:hypothetical protein
VDLAHALKQRQLASYLAFIITAGTCNKELRNEEPRNEEEMKKK